jgi:hypothetical protein
MLAGLATSSAGVGEVSAGWSGGGAADVQALVGGIAVAERAARISFDQPVDALRAGVLSPVVIAAWISGYHALVLGKANR